MVLGDTNFKIIKENTEKAFIELKKLLADKGNCYLAAADDLSGIFSEFFFNAYYDDNGNVVDLDTVDNDMDDDYMEFFELISKYVETESYIECYSDEGEHYRVTFQNGQCKQVKGNIMYIDENQLSYDRLSELLTATVNHELETGSLYEAMENLLCIGFDKDELINVFAFNKEAVNEVIRDMNGEK